MVLGKIRARRLGTTSPKTRVKKVITVTTTAHNTRSAPASISVITAEQIATAPVNDLADLLRQMDHDARGRACFVIGGAWGLDEAVRQRASRCISLSHMTLPHELARVVLLEQLYRAECILRKVPYHH